MDNGIKIRENIFEDLMKEGNNRKHWEMLCCSNTPLVPMVGAGMSAWCYPTWDTLLTDIVKEKFSNECRDVIAEVLGFIYMNEKKNAENIKVENIKLEDRFYWMEEIAECIFNDNDKKIDFRDARHRLKTTYPNETDDTIRLLRRLYYYVGGSAATDKRMAQKKLYEMFDKELLTEP